MKRLSTAVRAGLFALALTATPAALAQATFPSTPQAQTVKTWIDTINNPASATQGFDPRAAMVRGDFGGFDVLTVEAADTNTVVTNLRERLFDSTIRMTWMLDPADPTKMRGFRFQRLPDANFARLDDAALAAFVKQSVEKMNYSGAVIVARDGKSIVSAVNGLADREAKTLNTIDTMFRVGSMNKMMTAVGVMQLVQSGKVKLDAPVGTYLKDYPNKDFANAVTIHHLLTHTGGAGDIFGPQFTAKRLELKTLKDYVALYGSRAPEFTPGDNYRYANYGFVLLGRVIEEVSGQSYPDYLRDHVFKPAGMTRSGFESENVAVTNRAKGYMPDQKTGSIVSNADTLPWSGTSAGGGYSSVGDWLAFANALTSYKLLDKAHTDLLLKRKTSTNYAYGFGDNSTAEIRNVGHGGGAPGMNGQLTIIGDGKIVIAALSNVSPPGQAGQLAGEIQRRVTIPGADGKPLQTLAGGMPPSTEEQRAAAWKAHDADNDGKIDKATYRKLLAQLGYADQLDPYFNQRDKDKDGFISAEEYRTPIGAAPPAPQ